MTASSTSSSNTSSAASSKSLEFLDKEDKSSFSLSLVAMLVLLLTGPKTLLEDVVKNFERVVGKRTGTSASDFSAKQFLTHTECNPGFFLRALSNVNNGETRVVFCYSKQSVALPRNLIRPKIFDDQSNERYQ